MAGVIPREPLGMMTESLAELVRIAHEIGGQIPFWIQGGGGNVSVKEEGRLFIKASGSRLDRMSVHQGLAAVDLGVFNHRLRELLSMSDGDERENLYAVLLGEHSSWGRPSMETGFHSLLPARFVLHFHSLASLAMGQEERRSRVADLIVRRGLTVAFVERVKPGLCLTAAVDQHSEADVHLLDSHGVILCGPDHSILNHWREIETEFMKDVLAAQGLPLARFVALDVAQIFARLQTDRCEFKWRPVFPDAVVFEGQIREAFGSEDGKIRLTRDEWLRLNSGGPDSRKNLFEISMASYVLHLCLPGLPELSGTFASAIASLPTEKFRQGSS